MGFEDGAMANESADSGGSGGASDPDDVSQTNTQEAGVDEADSVKAAGNGNLFIAQHDQLVVVDAFPPDAINQLSALQLGGRIHGLYLAEDEQTVVALVYPRIEKFDEPPILADVTDVAIAPYIRYIQQTLVVFIDISNPADPQITNRVRVDGNLVSSRLIESRLYLVQGFYLERFHLGEDEDLRGLLSDYAAASREDDADGMDDIKGRIRAVVASALDTEQVAQLLPAIRVQAGDDEPQMTRLGCDGVYAPDIDLNHNHLLTVTSMDLTGDDIQQVAAIGSGWITYVSSEDLFIVQPSFNWWWSSDQHQQSAIHHFSIDDDGPAYVATGLVKGNVLNSFSLSYYQDHLRVATTQNLWTRRDQSDIRSTNHLFVLRDNDNFGMDVTGAVEGYADNERIFSARFVGERGYVVTFRLIDPLFSFDLSNPAQPLIAGELKIPGFSNYMHPIGDTHLLTIGRDGDDLGVNNNIAVKLFDVSDLSAPALVDSFVPALGNGYTWSEANWDHHAFTYYAPLDLLAIPVSGYNTVSNRSNASIMALNVDLEAGLSLAGVVDHRDLLLEVSCAENEAFCGDYYYDWLARPTRSVFMTSDDSGYLFSISNIGIKAVDVLDFETTLGSLLLPDAGDFYEHWYW